MTTPRFDGVTNGATTPPYDDPNDAMSNPTAGGLGDRDGVIRRTADVASSDAQPYADRADHRGDVPSGHRSGVTHDGAIDTARAPVPVDVRGPGNESERPRLVHLDDAGDLKVADGDSDIRGWTVRSSDGQQIGKVKDLVVDTLLMKVRYLEATLQLADGSSAKDRVVLISLKNARLDEKEDDVILLQTAAEARQLPTYARGAVIADADMRQFDADDVDDRRFFGGRRSGLEESSYIAPLSGHPTDFAAGAPPIQRLP
jgi:hypothetical protein